MMYCTKCGSDLKGNKVRCPACGYEVVKMKIDVSRPREARSQDRSPRAWAPPIPDQRRADVRDILESTDEETEIEAVEVEEEGPKEEEEECSSGAVL